MEKLNNIEFEKKISDILHDVLGLKKACRVQSVEIKVGVDKIPTVNIELIIFGDE